MNQQLQIKLSSLREFYHKFPNSTENEYLEYIMKIRHGLKGICPHCQKKTRFARVTKQRAYACQWCGWHTYPCVGTPFESSRTLLQSWFYAICIFIDTKGMVSAKEIQRQLRVTYKTAWRMKYEIDRYVNMEQIKDHLLGS